MPEVFTSECSICMYVCMHSSALYKYLLNFAQTKIGRVYVGIQIFIILLWQISLNIVV